MNDMNKIIELENKEQNINLQAAQRQLYTDAKSVFLLQTVLITIVPLLLSIINIFNTITEILSIYGLLFSFLDILLIERMINNRKQDAASIQELFDLNVLNIKRNLIINLPDPEIIERYSKKYKKKNIEYKKYLKNWYPDPISQVNEKVGALICQRSNCTYDLNLRKNYNTIMSFIIFLFLFLIVILSLVNELTLINFILTGLIPIFPMLIFLIRQSQQNKKVIKNLENTKKYINEEITVTNNSEIDFTIRNFQNFIFENRVSNPLVFDFFYWLKRKNAESELEYSIAYIVNDFNQKGHITSI